MKVDTYRFTFPVWALSALINGDWSGLEGDEYEEDRELLRTFIEDHAYITEWDVTRDCDGDPAEAYFSKSPEFGLACDCVDVKGHAIQDREYSTFTDYR